MLEDTVTSYLVIVYQLERGAARETVEATFEEASKKTLGGLLKTIRGHAAPANLVERLSSFTEDRNWLIHRIFREYWGTARNPEISVRLIVRLDAIADEALQIAKVFGDELDTYVVASGVTREFLDKVAREILANVRAGRSETGRRGFAESAD